MTESPAHPSSLPRRHNAPAERPSALPGKPSRDRRPVRRTLRKVLLVLAGIAIGAAAMRFIPRKDSAAKIAEEMGAQAKPGPWGELYTVPFVIAAPDELLPVRAIESGGTHWIFKNCTVSEISRLLESADMPAAPRTALLSPPVTVEKGIDIEVSPTPAMVAELPGNARAALYRKLASYAENRSAFSFIHKGTLEDRFGDSGISKDTLAMFRKFCCEHGDYLVFGGLPSMLALMPDAAEKVRFVKALTRQKTMLVRLRVTKDSDVKALAEYWGRGVWAPNIRAILEGIERIPGGTFMNVMTVLPPLPASQLYFYPVSSGSGAAAVRDCHWTSLNFFRDTTDTRPVDTANFTRDLAADYFPISGDPRYGDILILSKPEGEIVHSAVFIADDIVFTKNGSTMIYPWMFATVADLLKQYSFLAPDGRQLTLRYFRNRAM